MLVAPFTWKAFIMETIIIVRSGLSGTHNLKFILPSDGGAAILLCQGY